MNPVFATLGIADNTTPTPNTASTTAFVAKTPEIFTYDADGNLASDGRWTYTYDAENRLRTAETSSAAVTAGATRQLISSTYDYLGRRVGRATQSGWDDSTYTVMEYWNRQIYDGWNITLKNYVPTAPALPGSFRAGPSPSIGNLSTPAGFTGTTGSVTPGTLALEKFVVTGTRPEDIEVSASLLGSLNVTITDPGKIADIMDSMNQKPIPNFKGLAK